MLASLALAVSSLATFSAPSLEAGSARFRCDGGVQFARADMEGPAPPRPTDAAGTRLRRHLAAHPALPRSGWRSLGHGDPTGGPFATVAGGRFRLLYSYKGEAVHEQPCEPVYEHAAAWRLDPDAPPPTAASTHLDIVATESSCNSGEPGDDRAIAGALREDAREVRFAVFFLPRGGFQECPSNPPIRRRVPLDRPLGDRRLVDVGVFPAASRR